MSKRGRSAEVKARSKTVFNKDEMIDVTSYTRDYGDSWGGKVSIHFSADQDTADTIYRIILFCQSAQCLRSSGSHVRGI